MICEVPRIEHIQFTIHITSGRTTHIVKTKCDAEAHVWLPTEYQNTMKQFFENLWDIEKERRKDASTIVVP